MHKFSCSLILLETSPDYRLFYVAPFSSLRYFCLLVSDGSRPFVQRNTPPIISLLAIAIHPSSPSSSPLSFAWNQFRKVLVVWPRWSKAGRARWRSPGGDSGGGMGLLCVPNLTVLGYFMVWVRARECSSRWDYNKFGVCKDGV